jgi:hypothetical protein
VNGSEGDLQRLPRALARRRRRLYRAVGLLVLLALGLSLVWARLEQIGDGDDAAARAGASALARAVAGDHAAFAEAEGHFERACRTMVLDAYPLFALELTRQLAARQITVSDESLRPVVEALAAGDLPQARARLDALPKAAQHDWLHRLLADMSAATVAGTSPPPRPG